MSNNIEYCSINKNKNDKYFILFTLSEISDFFEFSSLIEEMSQGKHYIANPHNASHVDRESCLNELQELILSSLKESDKRKNSRAIKIKNAATNYNHIEIACLVASKAWNYWKKLGFSMKTKNNRISLALKAQFLNQEKNLQIMKLRKAQIDQIGAAIEFRKTRKKDVLQQVLDFFETEEILQDL